MKLAYFLFLIFAAFATENERKKETLLQPQKQSDASSPDTQKQEQNRAQKTLAVNESLLETQNSSKMKSKLNPRMSNAFPNETAVKVFRDMETNEISWYDGNNLVPNEKKAEIEICLQQIGEKRFLHQKGDEMSLKQKAEEMSNCLFDRVCKWYPPDEAIPFFKEVMFVISENVEVERRCRNKMLTSPLMIAARFDADEAVVKLIERNANVRAVDSDRWTALHTVSLYGRGKSCTILLRSGAQFNATDKWGNTPLMLAAQNGKFEVVKLLLEAGANPIITNKNGKTAVKLARPCNHQNCVEIIKAHAEMPDKIENKLKWNNNLEACTYSCLLKSTFFS